MNTCCMTPSGTRRDIRHQPTLRAIVSAQFQPSGQQARRSPRRTIGYARILSQVGSQRGARRRSRRGAAQRRRLDACTVRVTRQLNKPGAVPVFGPPKSRAGRRVVDFADLIVPDLRQHLGAVPAGALAFTSPEGTALSNTNFRRRVWGPAVSAVGLEGVHIHDLRHTGNQFTANAGANTRELMVRMGHDSERAALIYLRSSDKRQRALADAVGKAARAELAESNKATKPGRSGTRKARRQDDTSKS
jgi:integrase